jgi:hypothetical protein
MLARLLISAIIEQIDHGHFCVASTSIHSLQTQAAFAVQEVGDVCLLESRLRPGQALAGQPSARGCVLRTRLAQVFLVIDEMSSVASPQLRSPEPAQNAIPRAAISP